MVTIIKVRLLGTRRQSGTVPGTVPDLSGDGDAPPSPSPICPESGTLPRPRPRFAEIGDQAVVLEYPQRGRGFCPGLVSQMVNSVPTHLSYRTAGNGR